MARYSKIVKKKRKSPLTILPEGVQAFIARRIVDTLALFFVVTGLSFLAAILSYDHTDPSFNSAASNPVPVHNWLGLPGAFTADLFVQTLGLGAAVIALTFFVWGLRIWRRQPLRPLWARILTGLLALTFITIALARLSAGSWLVHPYLGGGGGTLMLDALAGFASPLAGGHAHSAIAIVAAPLGALALLYALAVSRAEIAAVGRFIAGIALSVFYFGMNSATGFYHWVRHYNDPAYAPPVKREAKPKKPKKEKKAKAEKAKIMPSLTASAASEDKPPVAHAAPSSPITVVTPPKAAAPAPAKQTSFALETDGEWELPGLDLLQDIPEDHAGYETDEESLRKNAELLQSILADFKVEGEIVSIHPGPVVTLYEFEPAAGTKTSRVISLSDDIARSMAAVSVRCAVIPGRNVIGIELPNKKRQTVYMREVMDTAEVQKTRAHLPLILGKDIGGRPIVADLAKMPHLLVAGTTGSGKSVAINTMLLSLLYRLPPEKCRMIMIDPKMLELSVYDDIPHLLSPVVTEPGKAVVSLKWAVQEMEERYRAMSKLGVRNIEGYNERLRQAVKKGETLMRKVQTGFDADTGKPVYEEQPLDMTELPYIVIVVDEFADLMLVAGKDVENAVQRLAQMARAAGIHLIMATQRPSVDVITGIIKANFPTRISFQVTSKVDSRTILNEGGAEQLLGMGDMLYMASGGRLTRVHGPFVSDDDVENVVSFLKSQGEPSYIADVTEGSAGGDSEIMAALFGEDGGDSGDELYDQAVAIVARERKASTSFIQRHLQIGYNRAARIIEMMEKQGVIGPANHVGKREVLVSDFSDA